MNRRYGNAQTIGRNTVQNTYFLTKGGPEGLLVLMADGTVDSVNGAYGAILACETVAKGFAGQEDIPEQLQLLFSRAAVTLQERLYRGRQPRVSLLAAYFHGKAMDYRRTGTIGIAAYGSGGIRLVEGEDGCLEINAGQILFASQGVWQALNEVEAERILAGHGHPYRKAQRLIEEVNRRNLKEQKSAVAVIVE